VSDTVPCPTCQAVLKLPPGAPAVRCPNCKTVLNVQVAPPAAPAAAKAPPLPFGRPAPARPAPVSPPAAPKPSGPAVRAKLAHDDDPFDAPPATDEEAAERERERRIREELAVLDEQERKQQRRYDELVGLCKHARVGMQLFAIGSIGSSLAALIATFFVVTSLTATPFIPLAGLAYGLMALHWLLTFAGFGYCCAGPREVRGAAVAGLVVTAAHVMFNLFAGAVVLPAVSIASMTYQTEGFGTFIIHNLLIADCICNLLTLTDLPLFFNSITPVPIPMVLMLALAAAAEFAKLSLLGIITNRYAVMAKDPDLGHKGMRFVYRIFVLVLIGPILKGMIFGLLLVGWISVPLLLATVGYFLWWAFSWFNQYQVMMDVSDILSADRLTDKRDRLDYV
jgi:LSD1 subclass zinc finger protein